MKLLSSSVCCWTVVSLSFFVTESSQGKQKYNSHHHHILQKHITTKSSRTTFHGHHRPKNNLCDAARPLRLDGGTVQGTTFNATTQEDDISQFGERYFVGLRSCEQGDGYVQGSLDGPGVWYTFTGTGSGMIVQLCTNNDRKVMDSYAMKVYMHPGSDRCHHPGHCVAMSDGQTTNQDVDDDCVTVPVGTVEGKDYHVLVTETVPSTRSDFFHLVLNTFENVPNDVCVDAVEIVPGHDFSGTIDTRKATQIISVHCGSLVENNNDHHKFVDSTKSPVGIWYSVKGTGKTLQLALPICRNPNNVILTYNVYKGHCNNQLECVGERGYISQSHMCLHNHDHSYDAITWPSVQGETYFIAVQSHRGEDTNFTLNLREIQPGHSTHIVSTLGNTAGRTTKHVLLAVTANVLLFFIIFGFAASVDTKDRQHHLRNQAAIGTGIAIQFCIMPLMGFLFVLIAKNHYDGFTESMGITLLVLMASPGGAFSNWWCSTFDADIGLSVIMTAVSTVLSLGLLPANVYLWSYLAYGGVGDPQRFTTIFIPLATVMFALVTGFLFGYQFDNPSFHTNANRLGTFCGTLLIIIVIYVSSGDIFGQSWIFYVSLIVLCFITLLFATLTAKYSLKLPPMECVTIAVESSFPNVAIATSFAITMFRQPTVRAAAMAVPVFYGVVSFIAVTAYCLWATGKGWTVNPELVDDTQIVI